jgi:DNA-binding FadR family transcriptional regulator
LAAAVGALAAGDEAGDAAAFAKARRAYYRALLSLANNRELRRLFASIQMPIVYAQYTLPDLQQIRLQDYRVIAREVLAGDEDGADLAAMAHVQSVRAAILRQVSAETPRLWATLPKPTAAPHTRNRDSRRPRPQT